MAKIIDNYILLEQIGNGTFGVKKLYYFKIKLM